MRKILFIVPLSLFVVWPAYAAGLNVQIGWNASTSTSVTGYKLYWGEQTRVYPNTTDVHNVLLYTINGMSDTKSSFVAATAYSVDAESDYSQELVIHPVKVTQSTGGTISPDTSIYEAGSSLTFTITPATGYTLQSVLVDGANVGAVTSYQVGNIAAPHVITAMFSAKPLPPGKPKLLQAAKASLDKAESDLVAFETSPNKGLIADAAAQATNAAASLNLYKATIK